MEWSIYELEADNSLTLLVTLDETEPIFGDIAVGPGGNVYGLTQAGEIRLITFDSTTTTVVGAYEDFSAHTAFVCDADSKCYTLDFFYNLFSFDLLTGEEELVMNVGELTPGDLAFYRGHLVYPSGDGFIKAININTLDITPIYCLPPEIITLNSVWGITNVFDTCGVEQLLVTNMSNDFFQIDVEGDSFEPLDVTYDIDTGGSIFGIGSGHDILASLCDEPVTETDCTSGLGDATENPTIPFYPNPATTTLEFFGSTPVKYADILALNGQLAQRVEVPNGTQDISNLSPGIYLLNILYQNGSQRTEKLVVPR